MTSRKQSALSTARKQGMVERAAGIREELEPKSKSSSAQNRKKQSALKTWQLHSEGWGQELEAHLNAVKVEEVATGFGHCP